MDNAALEEMHGEGFVHPPTDYDWRAHLDAHSLGWIGAHDDTTLGLVNVVWTAQPTSCPRHPGRH